MVVVGLVMRPVLVMVRERVPIWLGLGALVLVVVGFEGAMLIWVMWGMVMRPNSGCCCCWWCWWWWGLVWSMWPRRLWSWWAWWLWWWLAGELMDTEAWMAGEVVAVVVAVLV